MHAGLHMLQLVASCKLSIVERSAAPGLVQNETYAGVLSHIAQLPQLARLELSVTNLDSSDRL